MRAFLLRGLPTLLLAGASTAAVAEPATIIRKAGSVELLKNPAPKPQGEGPHALFKGRHYQVANPSLGDKVKANQLLRTGRESKVKLVYPNGDIVTVGPTSMFRARQGDTPQSVFELLHGAIRSQVIKREDETVEVETPSMAMGVRGTDFYVRDPAPGGGRVSVLRGAVDIRLQSENESHTVEAGETATASSSTETEESVLDVASTSRSDLLKIQMKSSLPPPEASEIPEGAAEAVAQAEARAKEATLQDIRTHQPELLKTLGKAPDEADIEALNKATVTQGYKQAPAAQGAEDMEEKAAALLGVEPESPDPNPASKKRSGSTDQDNKPSEPWGFKFYVGINAGQYDYSANTESYERGRSGSGGGGYLKLAWNGLSWLRLGLRAGDHALDDFNEPEDGSDDKDDPEENLGHFEFQAFYKKPFDTVVLAAGLGAGEEQMIYLEQETDHAYFDHTGYSFLNLKGSLDYKFSPTSFARLGISYALFQDSEIGDESQRINMALGYEHQPFSLPFLFGYGIEHFERDIRWDSEPHRSEQTAKLSQTYATVRLGYEL